MKITIERGKKRYEVVPCGRQCSFARKDGFRSTRNDAWYGEHCTDKCYLPKWFDRLVGTGSVLDGAGLREINGLSLAENIHKCKLCQCQLTGEGYDEVPPPIGYDDKCDHCEIAAAIRAAKGKKGGSHGC